MGRLAKTHSPEKPLTFEELCEEAFGSGLHPWEFYEYDMIEYGQRRKGIAKDNKYRYQELIIASTVPYMSKSDRAKVINDAFKDDGAKKMSLRERYEKTKQRYIDAGVLKDG